MDLHQTKLSKHEWTDLERPIPASELEVVKFIQHASKDVTLKRNSMPTIYSFLHMTPTPALDAHLFQLYVKAPFPFDVPAAKLQLKAADKIRLSNSKTLGAEVYELIIVDVCAKLCEEKDVDKHYFTLFYLNGLHVVQPNPFVKELVQVALTKYSPNLLDIVRRSPEILERNAYTYKYQDLELYKHQAELFTVATSPRPQLLLYIAPTGTGKTLSPLGLSESRSIIFICAARHVGLAFAKTCISAHKKIAFAFGCLSPADVKLHYFSVTSCVRDKKSGGIRQVDNSIGDKVEIMICDVQSYPSAMRYMLSFQSAADMWMFWDEPTISTDQVDHPLHAVIAAAWHENQIPNVVLSSATLPRPEEIVPVLDKFRAKFGECDIRTILTYDCKKSIQLLNPNNEIELPHHHCSTYEKLQTCAAYLDTHRTLLRYLDLSAVVAFLGPTPFDRIQDISITAIKVKYIDELRDMPEEVWALRYAQEMATRARPYASTIRVTTNDAHTLTDGPTMYLTDDVPLVAAYCVRTAELPPHLMTDLKQTLAFNRSVSDKIAQLEKDADDANKDKEKSDKMADGRVSAPVKKIQAELARLQACIRPVALPDAFIPNRKEHLARFGCVAPQAFTADLDPFMVEQVLATDVEDTWKLLLMMGIGVLAEHGDDKYTALVKRLATLQQLYLIIAGTNYIYGTNYQFCHAYIGKDLLITKGKMEQGLGRVGRGKLQQTYSVRVRHTSILSELFMPGPHQEAETLVKLLG